MNSNQAQLASLSPARPRDIEDFRHFHSDRSLKKYRIDVYDDSTLLQYIRMRITSLL